MTSSRIAFANQGSPSRNLINPQSRLSIRRQCELLGISRESYYYKRKDPSKEKIEFEETLMNCIDHIHNEYPWAGQRRIKQMLLDDYGFSAGRKLIRRLMEEMGLKAIYPKENLSKRNFKESIVPYLLRNKNVFLPNQVWSIDITYIGMPHGHMYLTAIIDWYSRKIVGWNLTDTLETSAVTDAVTQAVANYGTPGIINSDQGSQFTSDEYKSLLKELHIRQSMDGKSRWADNIMIERWFRSLKTELIYINEFITPRDLKAAIKDYVSVYNSRRPHQALGYRTPDSVYYDIFSADEILLAA